MTVFLFDKSGLNINKHLKVASQLFFTDLCQGVECKYGARCEAGKCVCPTNCEGAGDEPVCASNMMTYSNECELQKAMCLQSAKTASLNVVFYGDCRERFPVAGSLSSKYENEL